MKARLSLVRALFALAIFSADIDASAVGYFAQGGRIYDEGGHEIQVRGISHFGFSGTILQPQYLWAMGWKQQIAQIKSLGFNAIRVPFAPDTLYNTTPVDKLSYVHPTLNADLIGKTPLQVLDLWMAEADRQGMYVLLDFHSVSRQRQYPTWFVSNPADFGLIYNNQAYTKENWLRDLAFVAHRYAGLHHFFGIDIYNEPNGTVRWSTGDASVTNPIYFWKSAAEAAAAAVLAANPRLLIFVQGINGNFDGRENSSIPMNWGEDFQPQAYQPLAIASDKLVLTPHTYGPDVYVKSSFSAANFPANLPAHWDLLFGQFAHRHSIVIGEWGGKYGQGTGGQADATWQNAFVDYLMSRGIRNTFYWSYTPNSFDTGGILDDNLNVRQDKMGLLKRLWGTPPSGSAPPPAAPPPSRKVPAPATPPASGIPARVTPPRSHGESVKATGAARLHEGAAVRIAEE
jgi:aryl-phospho-beta-D-glucosidase BglC (GH1 family)